jgi:tRNA(fMet)-specific endonuclease VapC
VTHLLDTDTCIYWLKGLQPVRTRLEAIGIDQVALSSITIAELYFGAYNSAKVSDNLARAEAFVQQLRIFPLNDSILKKFGQIKADLRRLGQPLADFDLLIASTALVEEQILVTNNTRHYARIPSLHLESWMPASSQS